MDNNGQQWTTMDNNGQWTNDGFPLREAIIKKNCNNTWEIFQQYLWVPKWCGVGIRFYNFFYKVGSQNLTFCKLDFRFQALERGGWNTCLHKI